MSPGFYHTEEQHTSSGSSCSPHLLGPVPQSFLPLDAAELLTKFSVPPSMALISTFLQCHSPKALSSSACPTLLPKIPRKRHHPDTAPLYPPSSAGTPQGVSFLLGKWSTKIARTPGALPLPPFPLSNGLFGCWTELTGLASTVSFLILSPIPVGVKQIKS